jgi:hypothetical protein
MISPDTGSKPFSCSICGNSFARQDALTRHTKIHKDHDIASREAGSVVEILPPNLDIPSLQLTTRVEEVSSTVETSDELLQTTGAVQDGYLQHDQLHEDDMAYQRWPTGEELLQILMSDTSPWQVQLPITEFSPLNMETAINVNVPFSNDGSESASTRSGHRAVAQLSQLITQIVCFLTAERFGTS